MATIDDVVILGKDRRNFITKAADQVIKSLPAVPKRKGLYPVKYRYNPNKWVSARTTLLQPSELMKPLEPVGEVLSKIPGFDKVAPALSLGNYAAALTEGSINPYRGAEIRANDERMMGAFLPLDFLSYGKAVPKGIKTTANRFNFLWNNGKIIQKEIPYNPEHFYRKVGPEAIVDAEETGLIRGNPFKKEGDPSKGPFFGYKRGNPTPGKGTRTVVIEGTPESALSWIDSFRFGSRKKFIEENINNPNIEGYPFWKELYDNPIRDIRKPFVESPEAIKYMDSKKGSFMISEAGNEAFPFTNGSIEVPNHHFTYWKRHPIIGFRQHQFKL